MAFGYAPETRIELAIYGEQCPCAGKRCGDPQGRYGDNWRTCEDLEVFEGTEDELRQLATELRKPGRGMHQFRTGGTILNYLG